MSTLITTIGVYLNQLMQGDSTGFRNDTRPTDSSTLPFTEGGDPLVLRSDDMAAPVNPTKPLRATYNLAAGANVEINLQNFTDSLNQLGQSFSRIDVLAVMVAPGNLAEAEVGGAAANAWTGWTDDGAAATYRVKTLDLKVARSVTPMAVSAGAKQLKITNVSGVAGVFHVMIAGS